MISAWQTFVHANIESWGDFWENYGLHQDACNFCIYISYLFATLFSIIWLMSLWYLSTNTPLDTVLQ